jgi:hypothetical protein
MKAIAKEKATKKTTKKAAPARDEKGRFVKKADTEKKETAKKAEPKKATAKPAAEKKTEAKPAAKTAAKPAPAKKETAATKEPAKKPAAKKEAAPKEKKVWHITKRDDENKWQVKCEGNSKATKLFNTKKEAEEYVKSLTANNQGSRVVAHKKDGKFQKK